MSKVRRLRALKEENRRLKQIVADLDEWLRYYNKERPHEGRYCYGKTPMQKFQEAKHLALQHLLVRKMPPWVEARVEVSETQPAEVRSVG